jgi:hypothetical protein
LVLSGGSKLALTAVVKWLSGAIDRDCVATTILASFHQQQSVRPLGVLHDLLAAIAVD